MLEEMQQESLQRSCDKILESYVQRYALIKYLSLKEILSLLREKSKAKRITSNVGGSLFLHFGANMKSIACLRVKELHRR